MKTVLKLGVIALVCLNAQADMFNAGHWKSTNLASLHSPDRSPDNFKCYHVSPVIVQGSGTASVYQDIQLPRAPNGDCVFTLVAKSGNNQPALVNMVIWDLTVNPSVQLASKNVTINPGGWQVNQAFAFGAPFDHKFRCEVYLRPGVELWIRDDSHAQREL